MDIQGQLNLISGKPKKPLTRSPKGDTMSKNSRRNGNHPKPEKMAMADETTAVVEDTGEVEQTTETGQTIKVGETEVKEHSDTFKFTVPSVEKIRDEQAHMAGKSYNKTFTYGQVETDEQAQSVAEYKKWTLRDFVNDALRSNARASAYQSELAKFKKSDVSPEDIKARMINDYIRLGVAEDVARKLVEGALANK